MIMQEKPLATQAVMIFLVVLLTLVTVIGNGSFLAILARFKVLRRNFTNILIASLAVVHCLNALCNVPLFTMYFVIQPSWLEGKAWAIICSSLHMEFNLLNLVSMSALMLDRFFAVYREVEYFTWKTTEKAKIAVFLMWLISTIVVALAAIPAFYMDLDGEPLEQSQRQISQERKLFTAPIMGLFTLASTVLGILTCYSIHRKKKQRIQLNLPPLAAEARLKMDIRATYTVAMAVAIYYICYIPIIGLAIWWRRNEEQSETSNPWLPFIIFLFSFVSGALNPVIYILRNRRNRSALGQLLKDPCGTSAYQENPVRKENKAKQQEVKPPTTRKEDVKDCRDHEGWPDPGSESRRPTSAKIQIHQSHSIVKRVWKENEESADEQVAVAEEPRRDDDKVQDEEGESSGSFGDKDEECNRAPETSVRTDPNPRSDPRQPTSIKIQINQSHSVVKMGWKKNEKAVSCSQSADERAAVAEESRQGGEKVQDEEGGSSGWVREKDEESNRAPATTVRADTKPGSDPRPPPSIKIQIHQSHSVVKMAWKENENGNDSQLADEQVAVARESRRADEEIQDKEAECFGSMRDKNKKMKATGRKGIGTFARVNVRPNSI